MSEQPKSGLLSMTLNSMGLRRAARVQAAEVLRRYWDNALPVDPVAIARRLGLGLGASASQSTTPMVAQCSERPGLHARDRTSARFRLACAHEIGHYFDLGEELGHGATAVAWGTGSEYGRTGGEVYAEEFAVALLLPEREFLRNGHYDDQSLAERFGVPVTSVKERRRASGDDLGFLTKE